MVFNLSFKYFIFQIYKNNWVKQGWNSSVYIDLEISS